MKTFKRYLAEWVVAYDQSFEEAERPKFHHLLEYTHMGFKPLNISHQTALKDHIVKMGKSTIKGIQKLIKVCMSLTILNPHLPLFYFNLCPHDMCQESMCLCNIYHHALSPQSGKNDCQP